MAKCARTTCVWEGCRPICSTVSLPPRFADLRSNVLLRSACIDRYQAARAGADCAIPADPVTSLTLTADASLLLVSTLDSTHRLLDLSNGTVVQTFSGHKNTSYRSQSCIGAREETVVCGDEEGKVWRWDLESVSRACPRIDARSKDRSGFCRVKLVRVVIAFR